MSVSSMNLGDYLPPIYRGLLPELFNTKIPNETRATCDDCVMCAKGTSPEGPDPLQRKFFSPDTKCCTFHPSLPNFLVGAVLASADPEMAEGKSRLREKIRRGIGVTPRGISAPRKYSLLYDHGSEFFGRAASMLCPYYNRGQCTIWLYREAVCTTYFCKYERGAPGKQFWDEFKRYLGLLELKLSLYGVSQLETNTQRRARLWESWESKPALAVEELEGTELTDPKRREIWGNWADREEEFYVGCFEKVRALDGESCLALLGIDERFARAKVEVALTNATTEELPSRLRKNPELRAVRSGDGYLCSPTGMGDAFELHGLIFPVLESFDGTEPTSAVLERIARDRRITLPREVVAKLYYLGVLVEAP